MNANNIPAPVNVIANSNSKNLITNSTLITSYPCIKITTAQNIHPEVIPFSVQKRSDRSVQRIKNIVTFQHQYSHLRNKQILYNRRYKNILRENYTGGNTYIVKHGDIMFYIAWIIGNNFYDLVRRNNTPVSCRLSIGQKLKVNNTNNFVLISNRATSITNIKKKHDNVHLTNKNKFINLHKEIICSKSSKEKNKEITLLGRWNAATIPVSQVVDRAFVTAKQTTSNIAYDTSNLVWCWPANGKVIRNFSSSEKKNKGINIIGNRGQNIVATANGRVVYVGNALRGYGNLIIIKHNNNYLSAYAHNDKILVQEQQEVKAGQKIATMGNSGANSTHLHFEIRHRGKSVNPLQYLPKK